MLYDCHREGTLEKGHVVDRRDTAQTWKSLLSEA